MSINVDGVKLKIKSKNRIYAGFLILIQFALSIFVYISFAAHILWPEKSSAVAGVSQMISYEGYLTDTNGDPLGNTGEPYCFRFSIYDNANLGQGTKLWPAGTPATTMATTTEGVFSALIGQADSLTYNFYDNDSVYLNVEVNTATSTCAGSWETLGPRQQIAASGYSLASESVYGDILRTDISNSRAQIGTGAGGASPKFLGLDVKNTTDYIGSSCTTSGTVWYNSAISKALVCENSTIQALSNAGTSTIAAITTNSGSGGFATTGTVVFSNSNGVTFGINGNTITASVDAGGGGGLTLAHWPTLPLPLASSSNNSGTTAAGTNITASFHVSPMILEDAVSFSRADLWVSNITVAGTGSGSINRYVGLYTLNGGSALSLLSSFMFRHEMSQNSVTAQSHRFYWGTNSTSNSSSSGGNISANYAGVRAIPIFTGNTSLSAGKYYLVYGQVNVSGGSNVVSAYNNMYVSWSQTTAGQLGSAASLMAFPLLGQFSSTSTFGNLTSPFMPGSVHTSVITNTGGTSQWKSNYIQLKGDQS